MQRKLIGKEQVYLPTSEVTSGVTGVGVCDRDIGLCSRLSASCCRAVCTQEQQTFCCETGRDSVMQLRTTASADRTTGALVPGSSLECHTVVQTLWLVLAAAETSCPNV